MKTEKVNNFIIFLAFIVLCGGCFFVGCFFVYDFFFHRVGEGMRIFDWLYLLLGIIFFLLGVYLDYSLFYKRKNKKV